MEDLRKKLERACSNENRDDTLNDEKPLPRPVAQSSLQMANTICDHSRESPSSGIGTVEDGHAGRELMRRIPHAQDEVRARIQTCFADAQSKSDGNESAEAANLAHQGRDSAPSDDDYGKPVLCSDTPQDCIRHGLHQPVTEEENHEAQVELR
jgi:hypothetical protein